MLDLGFALTLVSSGYSVKGRVVSIDSAEAQEDAMNLAGQEDLIVMVAVDWRVIPAENLIARFQSTRTRLVVVVPTTTDAEVMLSTLEVGVDGIILRTKDPAEAISLQKLLVKAGGGEQHLAEFVLDSVRPIGIGDRVCIDTCSLLGVNEGLLVGSSSQGMILVLSEAAESNYVPSRPFRINAGVVSSYCLADRERTRYLSEFLAGDSILAVTTEGTTRSVTTARSKIEQDRKSVV